MSSAYEQLLNRLKNLFGTGIATRVETGIVQLRLATGIINDRIKRVHNYGFMSRPLPGAKGYTLFVGGDTSRGIAVCIEDERHQMELAPGDVAMLDDKGNLIHFHSGGIKVIGVQTFELTVPKTVINSQVQINGGLTTTEDVVAGGISVIKHTHSETQVITSPPIGGA